MFGPASWAEFYEEVEADLSFNVGGEKLTLSAAQHLLFDKSAEKRAEALAALNNGFKGAFAKYSAQTLYMVSGSKQVEDGERHYEHPMAARNLDNRIPDGAVEALHQAVTEIGGPLCRRYYRMKAALLGMEKLRWSDRLAPLPLADTTIIPFDEALQMVIEAYRSFSPTLARLVAETVAARRIDAPPAKGKSSGAFNCSVVLPGNQPVSFNLLNYFGSNNDVSTMAHELGHAVHGLLASEAQGPLMHNAPIAYAETASIFGEMTTDTFLRKRLLAQGDKQNLLAFLAAKLDRMMGSVVRQISFSNFERLLHGTPAKLSVDELCVNWVNVTCDMYGPEGDVFEYRDMDHLWAYIDHFHRPFYVYGYACGELLTQSLYAKCANTGPDFELRYLEMLRAGGTKDAIALLQPFGLDPTDPEFWANGIKVSMGRMIDEAETLARELGYNVP
jgi:oligoendopeptidase F